jgi:hypothetical protein
VRRLKSYLSGWRGYFGCCDIASVLRDLGGWIRRRLRCVQWKQWKVYRRRKAELIRLGADVLPRRAKPGYVHKPRTDCTIRSAQRLHNRYTWGDGGADMSNPGLRADCAVMDRSFTKPSRWTPGHRSVHRPEPRNARATRVAARWHAFRRCIARRSFLSDVPLQP